MGRYDKIVDMPHFEPSVRPRMSMQNRAAQFAPFAALTGFEGAIMEESRITDERVELDDQEIERLDRELAKLRDDGFGKKALFTYFLPDEKKTGGAYVSSEGYVKSVDPYDRTVKLTDGIVIPIDFIIDIKEIENESKKRREEDTDL